MPNPEDIRTRLLTAFPDAVVEVADTTGGGDHFEVQVRTTGFAGKTLVEQHQAVYAALSGLMPQIHALSLRTAAS